MKRLWLIAGILVLALVFGFVAPVSADTSHCPAGGQKIDSGSGSVTVNGVVISWSGHTVNVSEGKATFCVKAGNDDSDLVTLEEGTWTVSWLNPGGQRPDISYLVVYGAWVPTPPPPTATEPAPTATATVPPPPPPPGVTPTTPPGVTPEVQPTPTAEWLQLTTPKTGGSGFGSPALVGWAIFGFILLVTLGATLSRVVRR